MNQNPRLLFKVAALLLAMVFPCHASAGILGPIGSQTIFVNTEVGTCTVTFPVVRTLSIVGGWGREVGAGDQLRLMIGPGLFWPERSGPSSIGVQTRGDIATRAYGPIWSVPTLGWARVRRIVGVPASLWSLGLGVRFRAGGTS